MIEAVWSARRVAHQLSHSDCVRRESRFNLSSDDNRDRVWRPHGESLNSAFALQQPTIPTAGVRVWGFIAYNAWSSPVLICGTMTAQRYVHDILQLHVLPLIQWLSGAIFLQDNSRPHMARVSQDCLCTVTTLPWPARSPDLSPIENIWDHLGCCQEIYSQFGLAIHQNDHQARRRFVEWAQNEIAVVPDFHKRILFSDEAHFWLKSYVNKQNCRIWSEINPQSLVYADKPQTLDHLEDNIRRVIADIRPQMLEKVIENWTSRLDYIRASRGSHMPEIIFKM
ncbi:transposable element Tcb2 transposase [Trichonephila clavipes]|nr:transposable element Tcb2 transposase [Trichonephila clavipes]